MLIPFVAFVLSAMLIPFTAFVLFALFRAIMIHALRNDQFFRSMLLAQGI